MWRTRNTAVSVESMVDPTNRVSDDDRDRAVQALRANLLEGRLTLDEFADRAGLAYQAQVGADLMAVTRDLPAVVTASVPTQGRAARVTLAVFAHVVRRGRIRLRRRTTAVSLFADVDLDLRQAEIESAANDCHGVGPVRECRRVRAGGRKRGRRRSDGRRTPADVGPTFRTAWRSSALHSHPEPVRYRRRLACARRYEGRLRRSLPSASGATARTGVVRLAFVPEILCSLFLL